MDLNDPKIAKLFLLGAGVAGLLYLYFGTNLLPFSYRVQASELSELKERYETLSLEVNRARQSAKHLPHLEAEYEALQHKWDEANQLLPTEKQIASLLREISFRGQSCGVEFILFKPLQPVAGEFYTEHPLDLRVEGGYHEMASFLNELASMTRIVSVRNLEIEQIPPQDKERNVARAHFTAVAFTLGISPEAAPAAEDNNAMAKGVERITGRSQRSSGGTRSGSHGGGSE